MQIADSQMQITSANTMAEVFLLKSYDDMPMSIESFSPEVIGLCSLTSQHGPYVTSRQTHAT